MIKIFLTLILAIIFYIPNANAKIYWHQLVGYSIFYTGTITGYIDKKGNKKDEFEGCDYDRKLIIDDKYVVTCTSYSYRYAYRPDVVLLSKDGMLKIIVENEVFDVQKSY